jgi:aryl-alcohol dehydrogenase-like predicted oxidoreductase
MRYRRLGTSGLKVSELGLGTWVFGAGGNPDHGACCRIIHHALDRGLNLIDTADVYRNGESEQIVGEALRGRRHEAVLATKVLGGTGPGPNDRGLSRKHITQAVEASLRRLQTDYVDLYQIHAMDTETPIEETLRALDDLVRGGKARYIGASNQASWAIVENQLSARLHDLTAFVSEQLSYGLFDRRAEQELLPVCRRYGLGVLVWSPLNFGWLSGKYRRGQAIDPDSRAATRRTAIHQPDSPEGQQKLDLVERLIPLAEEAGATLSQYALAWILRNETVTAPLLGPRTYEQLEDNLGALDVTIPEEHIAQIDALLPPETRVGATLG